VSVDEVHEGRLDVRTDQDRRVLAGVLEQLLRVHHDRSDLLDVHDELGELGAGRGLRRTLGHERGGRAAGVDRVLLATADDTVDTGERHDGGLATDRVLKSGTVVLGDEVAAGSVSSLEKRDSIGHIDQLLFWM
jgi:hypothetical protein